MCAAAFLVVVTVTGLLLNHADRIGLAASHPGPKFVAFVYGIEPPAIDAAYQAGAVVLASAEDSLYANGRLLTVISGPLVGAVLNTEGEIVVATAHDILLTTLDGRLIEQASVDTGHAITDLGFDGSRVYARLSDGYAVVDPASMTVTPLDRSTPDDIAWSLPLELDPRRAMDIAVGSGGHAITWERVLMDLHSGRIVPWLGILIVDLAGFCLLYLCFSGLVVWTRTRNPK